MTANMLSLLAEPIFPCRFGDYVLVTHLGEGGMGRVYAALTPKAELCVIKRFGNPRAPLPADLLKQNRARFRREGQITEALRHPCIARTYAAVHDGEHSYLVQEYVRGITLEYLMGALAANDEHLSIPLATYVATQIADGLSYLHDFRGLGLVHRDLTPTNIMLSQAGLVKIIDFGIAKASLLEDSISSPNLIVGKPAWTAPEIHNGGRPDRRADLYALGLLYWYLLCGRDPTDHLDAARRPLPPPSTFRPEIAADLDQVVLQAIDIHPDRRFPSAADFRAAIAPFLPKGHDGVGQLAALVRRQQLTNEDEFFAELVDRARPLLGRAKTKGRAALLMAAGFAAVVAVGAFVWLDPGPNREQDRPGNVAASASQTIRPAQPKSPAALPSLVRPDEPAASPPVPTLGYPSLPRPAPQPESQPTPVRPTRLRGPVPAAQPPTTMSEVPSPATLAQPRVPSVADSQALLASAEEAVASGDNGKALRLARGSISARPSADAYILVGRLLSRTDPAAARQAFESALQLSPNNPKIAKLLHLLDR